MTGWSQYSPEDLETLVAAFTPLLFTQTAWWTLRKLGARALADELGVA